MTYVRQSIAQEICIRLDNTVMKILRTSYFRCRHRLRQGPSLAAQSTIAQRTSTNDTCGSRYKARLHKSRRGVRPRTLTSKLDCYCTRSRLPTRVTRCYKQQGGSSTQTATELTCVEFLCGSVLPRPEPTTRSRACGTAAQRYWKGCRRKAIVSFDPIRHTYLRQHSQSLRSEAAALD